VGGQAAWVGVVPSPALQCSLPQEYLSELQKSWLTLQHQR
jgi:hypothetical protein